MTKKKSSFTQNELLVCYGG